MLHSFCLRFGFAFVLVLASAASVTAQDPPANDGLGDALVISSDGLYTGTNVGATMGYGDEGATCATGGIPNDGMNSVWWTYTAPADGTITLDLAGSSFDTLVSIHLGSLAEVACDDNSAASDRSRIEDYPVEGGRTYTIRVTGWSGAEGEIEIDFSTGPVLPPANDDRAGATPITHEARHFGTNQNATVEPDEPDASCTDLDEGASVWWTYTASETTTFTIDFEGTYVFGFVVSIHDADGVELVCEEAFAAPRIEDVPVEAGATYLVRVASTGSGVGPFTFSFWTEGHGQPFNDDRANALHIVEDRFYHNTNVGATAEPGEAGASCTPGGPEADTGHSIWWRYAPLTDRLIELDMTFGLDAVLTIHDADGAELICDAGETSSSGQPLIENFEVAGGQVYFVRVSGYEETPGNGRDIGDVGFWFASTPALVNDDVADATVLPEPGVYYGTTLTATAEPGEQPASCVSPEFDAMTSVWWSYTAPEDAALLIDLEESDFNTILSVHDADLTEIACNDNDPLNEHPLDRSSRLVNVPVVAGQTVLIRVSAYSTQGEVRLAFDVLGPVSVSTVASGTIEGWPTWERPGVIGDGQGCYSPDTTPAHEPIPLVAESSGYYSFTATWEDYRGCVLLYKAPFDPELQCTNLIVGDCAGYFAPEQTWLPSIALEADTPYVLVISGEYDHDAGPYTVEALGPAPLNFNNPVAAESSSAPTETALSPLHPNPTRTRATLTLALGQAERVAVEVFDVLGRRVATLHEGALAAGSHTFELDGTALPAGVYLVRATGETFGLAQRATVVR